MAEVKRVVGGAPSVLSENDLKDVLARNNQEMYELLEKRDQLEPGTTRHTIIQNQLQQEVGETGMLIRLIESVQGRRGLSEV